MEPATACKECTKPFVITNDDRAFIEKISPTIAGTKQGIPPPAQCPDCRQQRRVAFRNDNNYYKNTCYLCKKSIVSIYSPDKPIPVLCMDCYWSDGWDPTEYGTEFDDRRPFFEQYGEMRSKVPRLASFNTQSENYEFTVHSSKNRNCYMACSTVDSEDVYFSDWAIRCRDSMDLLMCTGMELCYNCIDSHDSFNSDYLELCSNLTDSYLCFDCQRSQNLVGCVSVRGGKDMILNEKKTHEECIKILARLKTDPIFRAEFQKKFDALNANHPKRDAWNVNCENCTGNYITGSKNAWHTFHSERIEDGRYVYDVTIAKDIGDVMRGSGSEMVYECKAIIDLKLSAFCNLTYQCDNLLYCDNCQGSSYCFGSMGLKKHKYCILNKQYTKEEYEKLIPTIIESMRKNKEWGEFFPIRLSAFGYNESKAQQMFPMTKEQVKAKGWNWSDYESPFPKNLKTIPAASLPPNIKDVPDDVLHWAIICEKSGKPYKIIPQELAFYRKKGLPIPRYFPEQRHLDRIAHQNPEKLYDRQCDNCHKAILTSYAPDRSEKIFCEDCYMKTVY